MTFPRLLALPLATLLVGCVTSTTIEPPPTAHTAAVTATPTAPKPTTAPSAPRISLPSILADIRDAEDMDAAVDAYSAGVAFDADNPTLHRAYLRRVVDLGVPQLGVSAAERVLDLEPNNGLARAVLADAEARQGNFNDALTDIALAVPRATSEPFVQMTAAHLFAWYDHHPDPPTLPSYTRRSIALAHMTLDESSTYTDAYAESARFYREQAKQFADAEAAAATQPSADRGEYVSPNAINPADWPGYVSGPSPDGIGAYIRSVPHPAPQNIYPYAPIDVAEPMVADDSFYGAFFPGEWFYPTYGFIVLDNVNRHRNHDHGRDGDHRDGDHRGHGRNSVDDVFRRHYFGDGNTFSADNGNHLTQLRARVDRLQPGMAFRTSTAAGASARAISPSDPHFRGGTFIGRLGATALQNNSGGVSSFGPGVGPLSNIPGPLSNIPGPLSNIPGPLSNIPGQLGNVPPLPGGSFSSQFAPSNTFGSQFTPSQNFGSQFAPSPSPATPAGGARGPVRAPRGSQR